MTQKHLLIFAVILVIIVTGVNAYVGLSALSQTKTVVRRVANDEAQTCAIQARGLPAGHELAASMNDIHALLTLPQPPGAPPVPMNVRIIVKDLNAHLASYQKLESQQPIHRACK